MTKDKAMDVLKKIEAMLIMNNLWYTIEFDKRPDTKMIKIKEISIKIDEK